MFHTFAFGEFGAHSDPPQSSFVQHSFSTGVGSTVVVGFISQIDTTDDGPPNAGRTSMNLQYSFLPHSESRAHGAAQVNSSVQKFVRQPMLKHCSPDSIRPTGSPHQKIRVSCAEPLLKMHSALGHCELATHRA